MFLLSVSAESHEEMAADHQNQKDNDGDIAADSKSREKKSGEECQSTAG